MKRIFKINAGLLLLLTFVFSSPSLLAQEDNEEWVAASPESLAYHASRLKSSVPPYGLAKVKGLIAGIKSVPGDSDFYFSVLSPKPYQALSLREKFTYHMIHAEESSQNCDISMPILDEQLKVFSQVPDLFDEQSWSQRQYDFFMSNRDSVLALIAESVGRSKRVGLNYKIVIEYVNGWELIPLLIQTYTIESKDHDILTVLMLLMKKNDFQPFMTSSSYTKLYGPDNWHHSFIQANQANKNLIISRAEAFYHARKK